MLGKVSWHQFVMSVSRPGESRHIHSSLMSDLRVPVKIAQEQLGHASISTTLTSTRTLSTRRTGAQSKRWKIASSWIWSRMVSNPQSARTGRSRK